LFVKVGPVSNRTIPIKSGSTVLILLFHLKRSRVCDCSKASFSCFLSTSYENSLLSFLFFTTGVERIATNGLTNADIKISSSALTLPGFFRPTKRWDILVIHKEALIAAIELKSQAGPSFGNNFNNRVEEAIGTANDFWTAFRDGAFGDRTPPFAG